MSIVGCTPDYLSKLSGVEQEKEEMKLIKFKESAWKFVYITIAELLALAVTTNVLKTSLLLI